MNDDRFIDIIIIGIIMTILTLKITGILTISWLVLLSPVLIALGIGIIIAIIFVIFFIREYYKEDKRRHDENEWY